MLSSTLSSNGRPSRYLRGPGRQAGFSLVELLVTIVIMAEVLVGLLILFDSSSRLARAQTHLAEIQQSLRVGQQEVVRYARLAGVGGLPITRINLPDDPTDHTYDLEGAFPRSGIAVSVYNNVDENTIVKVVNPDVIGDTSTDNVVPGSDVLLVRGVLDTPLYYFDPPINIETWDDDGTIDNEEVVIPEKVRIVGRDWEDYPQDLEALSDRLEAARAAGRPVAMILRDTLNPNAYAIMEFDHADTAAADLVKDTCASVPSTADYPVDTPARPWCIKFKLTLDVTVASEPSRSYAELALGNNLLVTGAEDNIVIDLEPAPDLVQVKFPKQVGSIGLLEEYRFFIRSEWEVSGDDTTRLTPVLSRASFLPGTDTWLDTIDIADNVIDLQIAVGGDADPGDEDGYGTITENGGQDEVLFNATADTVSDSDYSQPRGDTDPVADPEAAQFWFDPQLEYHFLRINTLVQGRFADLDHRAPNIIQIEDFNRGADFDINSRTYNYNDFNQFHRRWLQTVVELRNLL